MNGAQRAAFVEMVRVAEDMATTLYELTVRPAINTRRYEQMLDMYRSWDAARNRYFELEAEARKAKSSARKSRGAVRQKGGVNRSENSNV